MSSRYLMTPRTQLASFRHHLLRMRCLLVPEAPVGEATVMLVSCPDIEHEVALHVMDRRASAAPPRPGPITTLGQSLWPRFKTSVTENLVVFRMLLDS